MKKTLTKFFWSKPGFVIIFILAFMGFTDLLSSAISGILHLLDGLPPI